MSVPIVNTSSKFNAEKEMGFGEEKPKNREFDKIHQMEKPDL